MNQDLIASAIQAVMPAARATGLGVSLCTIQAPSTTLGSTGLQDGTYTDVPGLVDLVCQDAPSAVDRFTIESEEVRRAAQSESTEWRHVLLYAYYEQLSPATNWGDVGWRAVVDGVTYDIDACEQDSQRVMSRLSLRKVTV